ncbi:hypothetical protein HanRHA438_Chr00c29g0854801 [Helianthus annuus]|nr:hypothetical protein HanRHA438_Chr00c29g0854801 [Helianthus annuus]
MAKEAVTWRHFKERRFQEPGTSCSSGSITCERQDHLQEGTSKKRLRSHFL